MEQDGISTSEVPPGEGTADPSWRSGETTKEGSDTKPDLKNFKR